MPSRAFFSSKCECFLCLFVRNLSCDPNRLMFQIAAETRREDRNVENDRRGDRDSIRVVWNFGGLACKSPDYEDESVSCHGGAVVSNV